MTKLEFSDKVRSFVENEPLVFSDYEMYYHHLKMMMTYQEFLNYLAKIFGYEEIKEFLKSNDVTRPAFYLYLERCRKETDFREPIMRMY